MRTRKGFTLIELMIVIAIISIIAAIAIPNLMQSRIRANEATAVTAVKNYATAQVTYQTGRQARVASNGSPQDNGRAIPSAYCPNFRNLFYGNPAGAQAANGFANANTTVNLALISKAHADAWAVTEGTDTNSTPTPIGGQTPYQGYHFDVPPDTDAAITNNAFWTNDFAQVAVPANSSSTGNNAFWVGQEGNVYTQGLAPDAKTPADTYALLGGSSPSGGSYDGWIGL